MIYILCKDKKKEPDEFPALSNQYNKLIMKKISVN